MLSSNMSFLCWCLICFGITNIIVVSKLFAPIRNKLVKYTGSLLTCHMCTGFWVGIGLGFNYTFNIKELFYYGILSSAVSHLLFLLIKDKQDTI